MDFEKKIKTLNDRLIKSRNYFSSYPKVLQSNRVTSCLLIYFLTFSSAIFLLSPFLEKTVGVNLFIASPPSRQWSYQEVASSFLCRPTSSDQETWGSQVPGQEAPLLSSWCVIRNHVWLAQVITVIAWSGASERNRKWKVSRPRNVRRRLNVTVII